MNEIPRDGTDIPLISDALKRVVDFALTPELKKFIENKEGQEGTLTPEKLLRVFAEAAQNPQSAPLCFDPVSMAFLTMEPGGKSVLQAAAAHCPVLVLKKNDSIDPAQFLPLGNIAVEKFPEGPWAALAYVEKISAPQNRDVLRNVCYEQIYQLSMQLKEKIDMEKAEAGLDGNSEKSTDWEVLFRKNRVLCARLQIVDAEDFQMFAEKGLAGLCLSRQNESESGVSREFQYLIEKQPKDLLRSLRMELEESPEQFFSMYKEALTFLYGHPDGKKIFRALVLYDPRHFSDHFSDYKGTPFAVEIYKLALANIPLPELEDYRKFVRDSEERILLQDILDARKPVWETLKKELRPLVARELLSDENHEEGGESYGTFNLKPEEAIITDSALEQNFLSIKEVWVRSALEGERVPVYIKGLVLQMRVFVSRNLYLDNVPVTEKSVHEEVRRIVKAQRALHDLDLFAGREIRVIAENENIRETLQDNPRAVSLVERKTGTAMRFGKPQLMQKLRQHAGAGHTAELLRPEEETQEALRIHKKKVTDAIVATGYPMTIVFDQHGERDRLMLANGNKHEDENDSWKQGGDEDEAMISVRELADAFITRYRALPKQAYKPYERDILIFNNCYGHTFLRAFYSLLREADVQLPITVAGGEYEQFTISRLDSPYGSSMMDQMLSHPDGSTIGSLWSWDVSGNGDGNMSIYVPDEEGSPMQIAEKEEDPDGTSTYAA